MHPPWNVRHKSTVATLCTLCSQLCVTYLPLRSMRVSSLSARSSSPKLTRSMSGVVLCRSVWFTLAPISSILHKQAFSPRNSIQCQRQCCGSGMSRIPEPYFSIPVPGSRVKKAPDPDPQQRIQVFFTQKIVIKLSEYDPDYYALIRISERDFFTSRIQGSEKHWIPDPDPRNW